MRSLPTAACIFVVSIALLWPWGELRSSPSWGDQYDWIAFNLVRHGEFKASTKVGGCLEMIRLGTLRGSPGTPTQPSSTTSIAPQEPYSHRAPGYPFYVAAIFSTFPESTLHAWEVTCRDTCLPPAPLRRRAMQVTAVVSAATISGVFALASFLGGSWMTSLVAAAGLLLWSFKELDTVGMHGFLAAFLLFGHAGLAALMWRRPRITTGATSGIALGLLVLTKAAFQYWLAGIAIVLAAGLWLDAERRRDLVPGCTALVLAALLVTLPWMARNAVQVGHFGISGRDGEVLAIRAEYGRMNWSEVRGAFAYWLHDYPHIPGHARTLAIIRRWLEPETGYANFDRNNPEGYYRRAKWLTGALAARADRIDPEWRTSQVKCDAVLRKAAVESVKANWLKHVALTPAFGVRGTGAMGAGMLGLLVAPAFGALLLFAWKRRDMALVLLMLPAIYGFCIHAVATHFIPRYAQPLVPIAFVVCALAAFVAVRSLTKSASKHLDGME